MTTTSASGTPGPQAGFGGLRVYTTCPQSKDHTADAYAAQVAAVSRWSEQTGAHGMLLYTDNGIADPWLVAHEVIRATERLRPLVAIQPVYLHPYAVAKMITTLAFMHGRAVDLNLLAGGFRNDLVALGDETSHDDRYTRLVEYTRIVEGLLRGNTVTADGRWYTVTNLRLTPALPEELMPGMLISGSSPAGLAAASALRALAVRYPRPVEDEAQDLGQRPAAGVGVRVGVIARASQEEAWQVALERFPPDRRGQLRHKLAMKISDSHWHRDLSRRDEGGENDVHPYWLSPFANGHTYCPYLVGSHERVGGEIARYVAAGFETFILDIPPDEADLRDASAAFRAARRAYA
jgi:alkanesulfonate monooxygenase